MIYITKKNPSFFLQPILEGFKTLRGLKGKKQSSFFLQPTLEGFKTLRGFTLTTMKSRKAIREESL
jgi:hypothetical protein